MNEKKEPGSGQDITEQTQDTWRPTDLGEASAYEGATDMARRMARGDETQGHPDERDAAGATNSEDTPENREDAKKAPEWRPTDTDADSAA